MQIIWKVSSSFTSKIFSRRKYNVSMGRMDYRSQDLCRGLWLGGNPTLGRHHVSRWETFSSSECWILNESVNKQTQMAYDSLSFEKLCSSEWNSEWVPAFLSSCNSLKLSFSCLFNFTALFWPCHLFCRLPFWNGFNWGVIYIL